MNKDGTTQAQVISDNGSYSTACLLIEVPVTAACSVIKAAVRELSGVSLDIMPCKSAVAMMVGVISDLQVGEVMHLQDNITLSWDSISVDGQHISEIHIMILPFHTFCS